MNTQAHPTEPSGEAVQIAAGFPIRVPAPSKSDLALASTMDSIHSIRAHMRIVDQRSRVLENVPGGRPNLLPAERIEYDSIGALFSDLRAALAKATGSAA